MKGAQRSRRGTGRKPSCPGCEQSRNTSAAHASTRLDLDVSLDASIRPPSPDVPMRVVPLGTPTPTARPPRVFERRAARMPGSGPAGAYPRARKAPLAQRCEGHGGRKRVWKYLGACRAWEKSRPGAGHPKMQPALFTQLITSVIGTLHHRVHARASRASGRLEAHAV